MAQIRTGTVTVTNGSSTVVGIGTDWVGSVLQGYAFNINGEDAVYSIAANVEVEGSLHLTAPYAGASGAKSYQITTSFTPLNGYYEPDIADADIAILMKHLIVRKLDGIVQSQSRNIILSTSDPTDGIGNDGDIWIKYTP